MIEFMTVNHVLGFLLAVIGIVNMGCFIECKEEKQVRGILVLGLAGVIVGILILIYK